MEKTEIVSKTKFLEWFCKEFEKMLESQSQSQRAIFLTLLKGAPGAVLKKIESEILSKVLLYEEQTGNYDFDPQDFDELCNEVINALIKYFLPENRA